MRRQIEAIMNGQSTGPAAAAALLQGIARVYDAGMRLRTTLYARGILRVRRVPCPVISVGNLTLGGTGKTPMTVYLARLMLRSGIRPAIVSRGYRGRAEKRGGIVSDGRRLCMTADTAGDEPFLMAAQLKKVPVVVGADRYRAAASALARFQPDVIILDDAFQRLGFYRDLNLVLLDAARPFGNGRLFPRGILREAPAALKRASALILTRAVPDLTRSPRSAGLPNAIPLFRSIHAPHVVGIRRSAGRTADPAATPVRMQLAQRRVFAFSGLARNDDFRTALAGIGCRPAGRMTFPDHHRYRAADVRRIIAAARNSRSDMIATTEKDAVKIADRFAWPLDLAVVGVRIVFADSAFDQFIQRRLKNWGLPSTAASAETGCAHDR